MSRVCALVRSITRHAGGDRNVDARLPRRLHCADSSRAGNGVGILLSETALRAVARAGGWQALILDHRPSLLQEEETPSSWVVMTRDPWTLALVAGGEGDWKKLTRRPGFAPWTDEYASILPLLIF